MTSARLFAAIGLVAALSGTALWQWTRPRASPSPSVLAAPAIAPAALYAATFIDEAGKAQALGRYQGEILVLNFWATWCLPCREEMPAFQRLHQRWEGRGVRFVGLSAEPSGASSRFGEALGITYPLWTGGEEVPALSRRLGNESGALPHTVVVGRDGRVLDQRVGPYTEAELQNRLVEFTSNSR